VIEGRGFGAGATVSFGGAPATDVTVYGTTALTARNPPHPAGLVDVVVTVPGAGKAALGNAFRYLAGEPGDRSPVVVSDTEHPRPIVVPPRDRP
jgi:hypothetical protein